MLIFEGPDNSGKSALIEFVEGLQSKIIHHKSKGPDMRYDAWMSWLMNNPERMIWSAWDRFFFSELVYGPIFRGKTSVTTHQTEVIESLIASYDPLIVFCHFRNNRALYENRPQMFPFEKMQEVEDAYRMLDWGFLPVVDYHMGDDPGQIVGAVADWASRRERSLEKKQICRYGRGSLSPRIMAIGINFARNNQWHTPFERSESGKIIHDLFRVCNVPIVEVYFTNAEKIEGGINPTNLKSLWAEYDTCQPRNVITFGKVASAMAAVLRIKHVALTHPGAFLRRNTIHDWISYAQNRLDENGGLK